MCVCVRERERERERESIRTYIQTYTNTIYPYIVWVGLLLIRSTESVKLRADAAAKRVTEAKKKISKVSALVFYYI